MEMEMEIEEMILVYILDFLGSPEAANDRQRLSGSRWEASGWWGTVSSRLIAMSAQGCNPEFACASLNRFKSLHKLLLSPNTLYKLVPEAISLYMDVSQGYM